LKNNLQQIELISLLPLLIYSFYVCSHFKPDKNQAFFLPAIALSSLLRGEADAFALPSHICSPFTFTFAAVGKKSIVRHASAAGNANRKTA